MEIAITFIIGFALVFGFVGSAFTAARHPSLSGGERPALPLPPTGSELASPPKRLPDLYELADVPVVRFEDRMGDWTYIAWNGKEYDMARKDGSVDPTLLGLFIAETCAGLCAYCQSRSAISITQVVRRPTPPGAKDLGLAERRKVGSYCDKCGLQDSRPCTDKIASVPFRADANLFDALKALAADGGKLSKEIRWRMLSEEYARLQPRTVRLAEEMNRLHAEIWPRTDLPPYR